MSDRPVSSDGLYEWDGSNWVPRQVESVEPPRQVSPDGLYEWDGSNWVPRQQPAAPEPSPTPTAAAVPTVTTPGLVERKKLGVGKALLIGFVGLMVIGAIGSAFSDDTTDNTPAGGTSDKAGQGQDSDQVEAQKSPAELAQAAVDDTDVEKPEVSLDSPRKGVITVEFRIADNFKNSWIRDGIATDVFDMAEAINDQNLDYKRIAFEGTFTMVDAYGNESRDVVFRAELARSTIEQINFDSYMIDNWESLNRLADSFVQLHIAFQD